MKDCKVVVEDISLSCEAANGLMLEPRLEKTHMTTPHLTNEEILLSKISLKTPIGWGKMNDERWSKLDDVVNNKLNNQGSLADKITLLENTIYSEAANLFGHISPFEKNLAGKSRRTKLSIGLVQEKNVLTAQISATSIPDQKLALSKLLQEVKAKLRHLRKSEKSRKKRWLMKKARLSFKNNPYKAGKELLQPKQHLSLKVDQSLLDKHKTHCCLIKTIIHLCQI